MLACAAIATAQKAVTQGAEVSETVTIEAIDYKARLVTLKDSGGFSDTVYAGPEVKRFDELKVGARLGRQCGVAPTEDDWPDEQGQLVDQPGDECLCCEVRATD